MSIKKNTIANYFGLGYTTIIGIVVLPFYLQYLGAEAYGLVGLFTLMQAWLYLLDIGISPTLGREIAYARGREDGFENFIKLLRSFEIIFFILACLVVVLIILSSTWISQNWINAENLNTDTIAYSVSLMSLLIGLRFFASLYRSGINGMEDQVWLSIANIAIVTFKFIGALLLLQFVTNDIRHFFVYQLLIGIIEVVVLVVRFYIIIPGSCIGYGIKFSPDSIRKVAPFALSIAYTAGISIAIMQLDKLILSGMLSLSEFAYLSLVALAANGLLQVFSPVMLALLPRMTVLVSKGKDDEMVSLYRNATQFVAVIVFSTAFVMGAYGQSLLYAWTGDWQAANWGKEVLFWFVLGNAIVALNSFQYNLQNAYGDLALHVKGVTISAVIQIPVIYFAATRYGAIGAGMAWFGFRFMWFLLWTPVVHRKFSPNLHLKWLFIDVVPIVIAALVGIFSINIFYEIATESRADIAIDLMFITLVMLCITSMGSSGFMRWLLEKSYILIRK